MKKVFIFVMMLLLAATTLNIQSCNSDDEIRSEVGSAHSLYGNWLLLGYGNDINYIEKENNWTNDYFLILKEDGSLEGWIGNDLIGAYTFKENGEFTVTWCGGSKSLPTNPHIVFMEDQLRSRKIKSYKLSNDELKLFYSSSEYLMFRKE